MSLVAEAFQVLFYEEGAYLGILLYLLLMVGLIKKWKFSAALVIPIALFIGMDYLANSLWYHGAIMFASTIFILLLVYKKKL